MRPIGYGTRTLIAAVPLVAVAAMAAYLPVPGGRVSGRTAPLYLEQASEEAEWITIEQGVPFVVPEEHAFVLTGLGTSAKASDTASFAIALFVDGRRELTATGGLGFGNGTGVKEVVASFITPPHSVIHVRSTSWSPTGRAWGWLAHVEKLRPVVIVREEDGPYVVPQGKALRLTALGAANLPGEGELRINGETQLFSAGASFGVGTSVKDIPVGLQARAGDTVSVSGGQYKQGRAWGYLVDH